MRYGDNGYIFGKLLSSQKFYKYELKYNSKIDTKFMNNNYNCRIND